MAHKIVKLWILIFLIFFLIWLIQEFLLETTTASLDVMLLPLLKSGVLGARLPGIWGLFCVLSEEADVLFSLVTDITAKIVFCTAYK